MAQGKYLMALAVVGAFALFMVGVYAMEFSDDDEGNDSEIDVPNDENVYTNEPNDEEDTDLGKTIVFNTSDDEL